MHCAFLACLISIERAFFVWYAVKGMCLISHIKQYTVGILYVRENPLPGDELYNIINILASAMAWVSFWGPLNTEACLGLNPDISRSHVHEYHVVPIQSHRTFIM